MRNYREIYSFHRNFCPRWARVRGKIHNIAISRNFPMNGKVYNLKIIWLKKVEKRSCIYFQSHVLHSAHNRKGFRYVVMASAWPSSSRSHGSWAVGRWLKSSCGIDKHNPMITFIVHSYSWNQNEAISSISECTGRSCSTSCSIGGTAQNITRPSANSSTEWQGEFHYLHHFHEILTLFLEFKVNKFNYNSIRIEQFTFRYTATLYGN